jgi:hypothetical protein
MGVMIEIISNSNRNNNSSCTHDPPSQGYFTQIRQKNKTDEKMRHNDEYQSDGI